MFFLASKCRTAAYDCRELKHTFGYSGIMILKVKKTLDLIHKV